ncbi:hypothetical protein METBIDRAFT_43985 [Metschnikowia bicuspidata var. bicuspidata NRRL YB-4993]|uniref:mRNA-capping enzyme subunit beta n=1 Tax=Metschnikowia bicuspidata var. bicuspidata NRRL YB-4993 TaxID=869754 RepID=A0A1A0H8V8_9ASCO|nr:hypothetical protein METBIDRAFT_43985 [Metschnikowia bicuspidata var. bicuspidata NRRL YB-4993]OBA20318.1 hypothetical protein METBIDRAFT_43985 [Metschnikowia bicuspidata var. bicuspidata NRRL YB-4993]
MNVGSILNGESPSKSGDVDSKEPVGQRPSLPDLPHRQSINNLLNETPKNRRAGTNPQGSSLPDPQVGSDASETSYPANSDEAEDEDDVDADAEDIDRELAAASTSANAKRSDFLDTELKKLQQLKAARKKPVRYQEPPVWARQWIPPSQQGQGISSSSSEGGPGPAYVGLVGSAGPAAKSVFSREAMVLSDLECLITGVIPPQLTVRTIAEWLYANFVEILLENRQYVELELKFGTLVDKDTGSRIDVGVSTECIYTKTANTRFDMGVHEVGWREMRLFLDELEKNYAEAVRKDPTRPRRKFSLTESNNTDYFYQITERNEKPRKIRISKDNLLSPPRYTAISKQRVSDLFIHNPSSMYDLRLSLLIEFPVDAQNIEPIMKKNKPSLQRGKARASYSHAPTVTRFDFTEVSSPRASKNKAGRAVAEHEKTHELELEIDTYQIFRGFDRVRDGSDTIRFEELVEIFLNNARCLNNRVTKLASK